MEEQESEILGSLIDHAVFGGPPPAPEISLRFFSKTEHPTDLTELLGVKPTSSHAPNSTQIQPDGTKITCQQGSWLWTIRGAPRAMLHEGIEYMLSRLPDDSALWQRLTTKYQAGIFCEFEVSPQSCSFELPVSVMRGLIRRNLPLNLDMAPASPDDEPNT